VARVARQLASFSLVAITWTPTGEAAVGERRNSHAEAVAALQRLDQGSSAQDRSGKVHIPLRSISVTSARRAKLFPGLPLRLVDLRGHRRVDHHLVDDRLTAVMSAIAFCTFAHHAI